ncbi:MAG: hypothetical protein HY872_03675 [Chloroflexi bacterium]|nr:hypothetical protein [Chloroflexota bacterium]MBI4315575.1 hypothetical protein [Chloroflexota bacterium]MBI5290960.1 hypothetical protein [Chloroflexota bacterium]
MSDVIPCLGSLGFFFLLFSFIIVMRYMGYRETMALAEKGLVRSDKGPGNGKNTLRFGIVITGIGLALCVGLYPLGFMGDGARFPLGLGPWMLAGFLPMFFGLALVLIYVLTREDKKPDQPPAAEIKPPEPPQG